MDLPVQGGDGFTCTGRGAGLTCTGRGWATGTYLYREGMDLPVQVGAGPTCR